MEPNSKAAVPTSSTRHLIDGGLASAMHLVGDVSKNDEGKAGELSKQERDDMAVYLLDMAVYLLGVPYPPAPKRAYTDELSERARKGFRLFHVDGDHDPKQIAPNVCGSCHRMPFMVSTNTPGSGMDAPTWRGAQDRWLILPRGRINIIDFDFYRAVAERGAPERDVWRMSWGGRSRFDPIWDMVLEMGTGFSGAFARQVTLSKDTAKADLTADLLTALEKAASDGVVVLECDGVLLKEKAKPMALQFIGGSYVNKTGERTTFTRQELLTLAADGKFIGTDTARHGAKASVDHPQPAIGTVGPIERQRGRQDFPVLHPEQKSMTVSGRHFGDDARVFVDGRRVAGTVKRGEGEKVTIALDTLPPEGMHLLQVQVPDGQFSNDFIFHATESAAVAATLRKALDEFHSIPGLLKRVLADKSAINKRLPDGRTPLSQAALRGLADVAKELLDKGADPNLANADGNTALHTAAFLCRFDVVELLLARGAKLDAKNQRGETPISVVTGPWNDILAGFYRELRESASLPIDLKQIEKDRPKMAERLREFMKDGPSNPAKAQAFGGRSEDCSEQNVRIVMLSSRKSR